MARISTSLVFICAMAVAVTAQRPSDTDPKARCVILSVANTVTDNSTKTCLDCQMQCVGMAEGSCGTMVWNGTSLSNPAQAPVFQCSTLPVADDPAVGTCAMWLGSAVYPNGFSLKYCDDCRAMCVSQGAAGQPGSCDRIAWAGNVLKNGPELLSFACPPKPSPRPSSPAIIPSPSPAIIPSPTPCTTPYAYISGNANLTTLKAAVDAAGLATTLQSSTLVGTLFAPTNAAFAAALTTLNLTPAQLLADIPTLTSVLSFHLVPGAAVTSNNLSNGQTLITAFGSTPTITVSTPPSTFTPTFTGTAAGVVTADVRACATIIHVINQVLDPLP